MASAASLLLVLTLPRFGEPDFPVYAFAEPCDDPHFPALAGDWLVGCGRSGRLDRALDLHTGAVWELPDGLAHPSRGPGRIWDPSQRGNAWLLETREPKPFALASPLPHAEAATAALDQDLAVALGPTSLVFLQPGRPTWRSLPAQPALWYPPALGPLAVAWVERTEHGTEVRLRPRNGGPTIRLQRPEPQHPRHVIPHGERFLWVEDEALIQYDPTDGSSQSFGIQTGFLAPPTSDGQHFCWEARTPGQGIDIHCSDNIQVGAPGNQTWPDRTEAWLLYRDGDLPKLRRLEPPR